ncbi:hypothetical protein JCM17961_04480 [Endothiovibrio diazotrophicus]
MYSGGGGGAGVVRHQGGIAKLQIQGSSSSVGQGGGAVDQEYVVHGETAGRDGGDPGLRKIPLKCRLHLYSFPECFSGSWCPMFEVA